MIHHLRLIGHKGIRQCELRDLGSINVLVGRNNSGKSSILEAILEPTKSFIGEQLTEEKSEELAEGVLKNLAARYSGNFIPVKETFRRELAELRDKIVFENDLTRLTDSIYPSVSPGGRFQRDIIDIYGLLDSLFARSREFRFMTGGAALIPAKRQLDRLPSINFEPSGSFSPSGSGLLAQLFYLKNQPVSSDEYRNFIKVLEAFKDVSDGVEFNIVPTRKAQIELYFDDANGNWFPSESCGLGLQDILVIVSFLILNGSSLVMLEEPENHIHPDRQRRLLNFLRSHRDRQFMLATHSGTFLDPSYIHRAIYVERGKGEVTTEDRTGRTKLLKELGYSISDNIGCDIIVLTEGPSDGIALEEICRKIGFWNDFTIRFWPLGGDNMARFDFSLISDSYHPRRVIALIDHDPKSRKARDRFKAKCAEAGIDCFQLDRYAIENYATMEAINSVGFSQIAEEELKPNESAESQLQFSIKGSLARIFASMTLDELQGTDLLDFCHEVGKRVRGE